MEESRQTTDIPFVNEIVMNEYTLREIMPDLWTRKASRNRLPLTLQPDTLHYPLPLLQSPLLFTNSMILIFRIYNKKETLRNQRSSHF